ncbi:hypothetical protein GGS23DRAFT_592905 [Durotheca rogersii]|uniref:uncharacterized protein n=1 Tax=Durotheca rogersii TaxID=419775 RepID=UPI002220DAD8|nr:uncharacterized protein GGS23DRAFT_592905 [Durotheca rogersii]KAI5867602.1 hypothetical protein GGS23DRAFT_592905 [Durotheca rogersii]
MSCRMPLCYHVRPDGTRAKLDHEKDTVPGTAFYFCSIHRVYHCIVPKSHRRVQQPDCGECAWLLFAFPKEAAKYPDSDIPVIAAGQTILPTETSAFGYTTGYENGFRNGVLLRDILETMNRELRKCCGISGDSLTGITNRKSDWEEPTRANLARYEAPMSCDDE